MKNDSRVNAAARGWAEMIKRPRQALLGVIQNSIFQKKHQETRALLGQKLTNGSKNGETAPRTRLD
jgi:hypothetical protein